MNSTPSYLKPTRRDLDLIKGHSFVQRALRESVSMKEVREYFLSFLSRNETHLVCSDCGNYDVPKMGCCTGCPTHSVEVGCLHRNTGCLDYACKDLWQHLKVRNADAELRMLAAIFRGLDRMRGNPRLRDDAQVRVRHSRWSKYGYRAELVLQPGESREQFLEHAKDGGAKQSGRGQKEAQGTSTLQQ